MRACAPKREAMHSELVTDESRAHLDALRLLVGLFPHPAVERYAKPEAATRTVSASRLFPR